MAYAASARAAERWIPKPLTSFDWILDGKLEEQLPAAEIVDLDGFDADVQDIQRLKHAMKKAVCYINVGAWEDWRDDKAAFPKAIIGKAYPGWEGERFFDTRQREVLVSLMRPRFQMCRDKGFDSVEPDNIDNHEQDTGFKISRDDQLKYNIEIAKLAHGFGLAIALKNVPDMATELQPHFDWMLLEDCFAQAWCAKAAPFTKANKAVYAVEYTDSKIDFAAFCKETKALGIYGLMKKRNLNNWVKACPQ